jgi:hypothetical protein
LGRTLNKSSFVQPDFDSGKQLKKVHPFPDEDTSFGKEK